MENHIFFMEKLTNYYEWQFSIDMLIYQRVTRFDAMIFPTSQLSQLTNSFHRVRVELLAFTCWDPLIQFIQWIHISTYDEAIYFNDVQ